MSFLDFLVVEIVFRSKNWPRTCIISHLVKIEILTIFDPDNLDQVRADSMSMVLYGKKPKNFDFFKFC